MTHHPKEGPNSLSRRSFVLRGAGAAVALSGAGPLLAACGNSTSVPESTNASRVVLKGGQELKLADAADVGRDNAGVLVFEGEGDPRYIRWEDVRRIDFEDR